MLAVEDGSLDLLRRLAAWAAFGLWLGAVISNALFHVHWDGSVYTVGIGAAVFLFGAKPLVEAIQYRRKQ